MSSTPHLKTGGPTAISSGTDGAATLADCVAHVLLSSGFRSAPVLARLLKFLAIGSHPGTALRLTAYQIAVAVFDQPTDFDPQTNSLVRVNMGRLRQLLAEYYAETGADDPWQLYLPRGSYTLRLVENKRERASGHSLPSVAVVRFDNLIQDPERNWFCDGMTLELIHLLTQNAHLRVVVPHTLFPLPWRMGQSVKLTTDYELVCGVAMKDTGKKPPNQFEFHFTATLNEVAGQRTLWTWETGKKKASIKTLRGALETIATKTWEFVVAPHAPVAPLPKGKLRWQHPE
jgi:hypothetical protein